MKFPPSNQFIKGTQLAYTSHYPLLKTADLPELSFIPKQKLSFKLDPARNTRTLTLLDLKNPNKNCMDSFSAYHWLVSGTCLRHAPVLMNWWSNEHVMDRVVWKLSPAHSDLRNLFCSASSKKGHTVKSAVNVPGNT